MNELNEIIQKVIKFRNERDWEQFHDIRNLSLALFLEAAELNELFLWKKETESDSVDIDRIKEELADILIYAILIAEKRGLNINDIINSKIDLNEKKYPIEKAKGTSKKYSDL